MTVPARMSRLLRAMIAGLVAALGLLAQAQAASGLTVSSVCVYTYDGIDGPVAPARVAYDRGPPVTDFGLDHQRAPGGRSLGGSPCPGSSATSAGYAYDTPTESAYVDISSNFATREARAGGHLGPLPSFQRIQVAAKSGDEFADLGHAGIHKFPGIQAGKSQFFDGMDLQALSKSRVPGVLQKNGNTRYVMRGPGEIGVDAKTGLPTDIYTVIRKPDGSVLTMFPGTSKLS